MSAIKTSCCLVKSKHQNGNLLTKFRQHRRHASQWNDCRNNCVVSISIIFLLDPIKEVLLFFMCKPLYLSLSFSLSFLPWYTYSIHTHTSRYPFFTLHLYPPIADIASHVQQFATTGLTIVPFIATLPVPTSVFNRPKDNLRCLVLTRQSIWILWTSSACDIRRLSSHCEIEAEAQRGRWKSRKQHFWKLSVTGSVLYSVA